MSILLSSLVVCRVRSLPGDDGDRTSLVIVFHYRQRRQGTGTRN
ncbi:MAG: hypothetical protein V7L29_25195 [Nostoc sp.]